MTAITNFAGYYRFLSNFYYQPFIWNDREYRTAEHAYQSQKPRFEADANEVVLARTPGEAKRIANSCAIAEGFHERKLDIMESVCRAKFEVTTCRFLLASTGRRELIEGNTWGDIYWGVCKGVGQNNLGKILMKIRDNA